MVKSELSTKLDFGELILIFSGFFFVSSNVTGYVSSDLKLISVYGNIIIIVLIQRY